MRRILLSAAFLLTILLFTHDAQACFKCCVPPPYTRAVCCSTICGMTNCEATSGYGSFCAPRGEMCADNEEYCNGGGEYDGPDEQWVKCEPPLSLRWTLVAVKIDRPATRVMRTHPPRTQG